MNIGSSHPPDLKNQTGCKSIEHVELIEKSLNYLNDAIGHS